MANLNLHGLLLFSLQSTEAPKDIFEKYSEFGEKLNGDISGTPTRLQPLDVFDSKLSSALTGKSGSSSGAPRSPENDVNSLNSNTTLPDIDNRKMPVSEPTNAVFQNETSLTENVENAHKTPAELQTRNEQEETDRITRETHSDQSNQAAQGGLSAAMEREASLFTLTKVVVDAQPEPDVSPVATPVMFRPMTREETRLSFNDRMERVLQGQVHVTCPPDDRALKLYVSSGFSGSKSTHCAPQILNLVESLSYKIAEVSYNVKFIN